MAFKSPGIYFTEIDNTEYVNPTAEINTTVAIVGFAKKGPIGEPIEINSYSDFKSVFGTPISGTYAGLAVRSVLSAGGTVLYVRIADESLASKSNVILKNGSKKVNGCLIVNNKNSITVDSKINGKTFANGEVYASDIIESGSDRRKTVILRSPANGRFAVTDMLEQLNNGLKSQVGFTEYGFKTPVEDGYKVFKANVSTFTVKDENNNTVTGDIGPYFVNVGRGMSLENVVSSINSAISKGTNPYQIFKISEKLINGFADKTTIISDEQDAATAYINNFSGGTFKVGVKKSDSEKVTDIKINVKGAAQDKVTMQELADCINDAFEKQGVGINCKYIYNKNITETKEKSLITSAGLLFFATDYMSFEILPVLDDEGTYAKSLFAPVLQASVVNDVLTVKDEFANYTTDNAGNNLPYLLIGKSYNQSNVGSVTTGTVNNETVYYPVFNNGTEQNESGTEVAKIIPFNLAFEVGSSVQNSFESGIDTYFEAVAEKDTNTIVFKVKKTDDKFVEDGTTITINDFNFKVGNEDSNYEYLFTKYTGAVSTDSDNNYSNLYTNLVDLNKKALGSLKRSYTGQKGIDNAVEIYRGEDQRIYITQKDSTDVPSIENTSNGTYNYSLKDLFGETVTEEEFERQKFTAGKDSVLLKVEGKMEIKPENEDMIIFTAKEFGSGTNNVGIEIFTSVSPIDETYKEHYINLYVDGIKKESWEDVSYDPESDRYFKNLINDEVENGGSAYVHVDVRKGLTLAGETKVPDTASLNSSGIVYLGIAINDKSVNFSSLTEVSENDYTSYDYRLGNDGAPAGDPSDLFLTAMNKETSGLANKDLYSWHILITPDDGQREEIQNAAIELCEYMEDAIYIADPPHSLSRDAVIKWHNGALNRTTPLQSNYCCTYWPWVKVYNAIENKYQYVMPSLIMAAQFCKVDNNYAPWYAPAGSTNGYCSTALDLEVNSVDKRYPNKIDRDALYLDQNRINPFLKLRNGNILAYGEKTCQRKNSTLTKIHTRRMLIALKKELNAAIKGFIFQPTVGENINKIRSNVTSIMEEYKNKGAIDSYNVDTSMNTTETLQQDILYIAISCVPVGCIEQVEITFTLNKSAD